MPTVKEFSTEIDRLRAVLQKIANRKPCTYSAAAAFYISRRDAKAALAINIPGPRWPNSVHA